MAGGVVERVIWLDPVQKATTGNEAQDTVNARVPATDGSSTSLGVARLLEMLANASEDEIVRVVEWLRSLDEPARNQILERIPALRYRVGTSFPQDSGKVVIKAGERLPTTGHPAFDAAFDALMRQHDVTKASEGQYWRNRRGRWQ
jgi:hypothetical protein